MIITQNILKNLNSYFFCFVYVFFIINPNGSKILAKERLKLKSADILERKMINNTPTKIISGKVVFTKGPLILRCDQGMHFEENDLAILYGNVSASKDDLQIECDTLKFFSKMDKILGIGKSHVWNESYDLKADSITVYTKIDSGIAHGNTILVQKNQTITANRIEYQKIKDSDGVSFTSIGNVTIKDSLRTATCGRARYNRKKENTELKIDPQIKDKSKRTLSGKTISLSYNDEQLTKLYIPDEASAITNINGYRKKNYDGLKSNDTLDFKDSMNGSELIGFFNNGSIDSLRIHGMAQTLYHIFDDSVYQGKNDASGDTIIMSFHNNELEKLNIIAGARGTYSPDSISADMKSPVKYSADYITYLLKQEKSDFNGNASIEQENTNLSSGFIEIDWQSNMLYALPFSETHFIQKPTPQSLKRKVKTR